MTWTAGFREMLSAPEGRWAPQFSVTSVQVGDTPLIDIKYCSHRRPNYDPILMEPISISGARLTPRTWETSQTTFTFSLAIPMSDFRKGVFVRLECGVWTETVGFVWETIALGQVTSVKQNIDHTCTVNCRDLIAALNSRPTTTRAELPFFWEVDTVSTVITLDYAATDPTVTVSDTTGFQKDSGTGGAFVMTPNSGADFILSYTGSTATTFTGCSTTGQYGTTAAAATVAGSGGAIAAAARIHVTPPQMVRGFLTGQRSGASTWPTSWNASYPDEWWDMKDATAWSLRMGWTSGGISQAVQAAQTDGASWLKTTLQPYGAWIVWRQNQLSIRYACQPYEDGPPGILTVDDTWIDKIEIEQQDSSIQVSYYNFNVTSDGGNDPVSTSKPRSLPALDTFTLNMPDMWASETANRQKARDLQKHWILTIPQRWRIWGADMRFARLCIGDVIEYGGRLGTVIATTSDWVAGSAQIDLVFLDPDELRLL